MIDKHQKGQGRGCADSEPLPGKPGDKEDGGHDQYDVHGSAQVGLRQNQSDADQHGSDGGQNRLQKILFGEFQLAAVRRLQIQEPGQIENHGELGQFGWLNVHGTKLDPTMRGVGFVEEESADQQEHDNAEGGVHNGGFAQAVIVESHQRKHAEQADDQPGDLPQEKVIGVAVLMFAR